MCLCVGVFKFFSETIKLTEDKLQVEPPCKRGENLFNDSGHLLSFILTVSASKGGGWLAGTVPKIWTCSARLLAGYEKLTIESPAITWHPGPGLKMIQTGIFSYRDQHVLA